MGVLSRPVRVGAVAVSALAITAFTGALASAGAATAAPAAGQGLVALAGSVSPTTDVITGSYANARMQIEVAVAPRDQAGLNAELSALYDKNSPQYHRWLTTGQFDARYAPTPAAQQAVAKYLRDSGLKVESSGSPFLIRATGSSTQVSSTFHTTLSMFKGSHGTPYFANSTPVYVPATVAGSAIGVVGLTNTVRDAQHVYRFNNTIRPSASPKSATNCETGYPTAQQLFDNIVGGQPLNLGYGAGPGCSGLTPSQTNSLYGAPNRGPSTKGAGVNLAVFELSAYQHSDIATWAHQFYGPHYTPPLVDVTVDGGPLAPICPSGDQCPPQFEGYSGDIEVVADIENQLAVAPDVKALTVYNAPNDFTGQTELDEWSAIAKANAADAVSSSWAVCEQDITATYAQAENAIFQKMAAQGQSVFGASGDTGAFGCIRSDGTTGPAVPAAGHQRRRHLVRELQPGHQPAPELPGQGRGALERRQPVQQRRPERGQRQRGRLLLVRGHRRRRRRQQHLLGHAVVPEGSRRHQLGYLDELLAGQGEQPVPRGAGHLGQRRRVHAVRRVLHRQLQHPVQRVRPGQPEPAGSRVVRDRRDEPVLAAGIRDRRRPRQLPAPPHR